MPVIVVSLPLRILYETLRRTKIPPLVSVWDVPMAVKPLG